MPPSGGDGAKAALWRVALPVVIQSPTHDRSARADRAAVPPTGGDGDESCGGRGADCDLRAAQPASALGVVREVARRRQNPLSVGRRESEFDPAARQHPRVDPADRFAAYLYGAAAQPAVYAGVGREVAGTRQDSRAAAGLPAKLSSAIVKAAGDDAACLVVALRGGAR